MDYKEPVNFFDRVVFSILPIKQGSKLGSNTTPKITNIPVLTCVNIAPVTIINFIGGSDNHSIKILGDGFTTIANNINIKTNTGVAKLLAANKVYTFTYISDIWYENA